MKPTDDDPFIRASGEGLLLAGNCSYTYPPLWGKHSYNQGAGLFRLSSLAGYVRYNMPLGSTYERPQLTDEEAWDVAAYINSQPRPPVAVSRDWPNIAGKPFDHPFGPYAARSANNNISTALSNRSKTGRKPTRRSQP